jgi:hypothetical protein
MTGTFSTAGLPGSGAGLPDNRVPGIATRAPYPPG